MFDLTPADLARSILGCADGPASFNGELTRLGGTVVSADPLYRYSRQQIATRIQQTSTEILAQTRQTLDNYHWDAIADVDELGRVRMQAMEVFLDDYEQGLREGRYLDSSLPRLPFEDQQFDLALCSHYLFLYSDQIPLESHVEGLLELCRVAAEVRVFPLVALDGRLSVHLGEAIRRLIRSGIDVEITGVPYRFQKGAYQMLVATTQ